MTVENPTIEEINTGSFRFLREVIRVHELDFNHLGRSRAYIAERVISMLGLEGDDGSRLATSDLIRSADGIRETLLAQVAAPNPFIGQLARQQREREALRLAGPRPQEIRIPITEELTALGSRESQDLTDAAAVSSRVLNYLEQARDADVEAMQSAFTGRWSGADGAGEGRAMMPPNIVNKEVVFGKLIETLAQVNHADAEGAALIKQLFIYFIRAHGIKEAYKLVVLHNHGVEEKLRINTGWVDLIAREDARAIIAKTPSDKKHPLRRKIRIKPKKSTD